MDPVEYIRSHSGELIPAETGESPVLTKFSDIKAIVFDIYGTLLISTAGDISLAGGETAPEKAMQKALEVTGIPADPAEFLARYYTLIEAGNCARDIPFPEVEIREIWQALLIEFGHDPAKACDLCIAYECEVNPVWPMPGLSDCLDPIRSSGRILGIISNAQFYTPLLFPALQNQTLEQLGFDPCAMVFSYQIREGKPSRKLYSLLAKNLKNRYDISPNEILYIGNDRLKDIWPAQQEGLKTVLFAGDARSLRWRKDDARLATVQPDAVVTHLNQIPKLFL
ncbi:MAG: HAD family hydrolase [Verrucomicrobiales bacterium]|nr:HAD family hydrolase [Verrucomicrobiales bacterium]